VVSVFGSTISDRPHSPSLPPAIPGTNIYIYFYIFMIFVLKIHCLSQHLMDFNKWYNSKPNHDFIHVGFEVLTAADM
jgi:hypothetical protein